MTAESKELSVVKVDDSSCIDSIEKRLVAIREKLNLNQRELAHLLNMEPSHYNLLETGKAVPGYQFLHKISSILNISIRYLLRGEGKMFYEIEIPSSMTIEQFDRINENPNLLRLFWFLSNSKIVRFEMIKYFKISLLRNFEAIIEELKNEGVDESEIPK